MDKPKRSQVKQSKDRPSKAKQAQRKAITVKRKTGEDQTNEIYDNGSNGNDLVTSELLLDDSGISIEEKSSSIGNEKENSGATKKRNYKKRQQTSSSTVSHQDETNALVDVNRYHPYHVNNGLINQSPPNRFAHPISTGFNPRGYYVGYPPFYPHCTYPPWYSYAPQPVPVSTPFYSRLGHSSGAHFFMNPNVSGAHQPIIPYPCVTSMDSSAPGAPLDLSTANRTTTDSASGDN